MNDTAITFVGAGALAQALAVHLAGVAPVTLLATPRSSAAILGFPRIRLSGQAESARAVAAGPAREPGTIGVIASPADLGATDNLIFATKGNQLAGAIDEVRPFFGGEWVAGLQNGVQKDDLLIAAFGEATVGAATLFNARRGGPGEIVVGGTGKTYFGDFAGHPARASGITDLVTASGLGGETPADIRSLLWTKCINAVGVFGVSALTRTASTDVMCTPDLVNAYLRFMREAADIAAASGVRVADFDDLPVATYLDTPREAMIEQIVTRTRANASGAKSVSSMAQDVLSGRQTEVDSTFGDLYRRASDLGVAAPMIELARDLLRGLNELVGP
jgi:2-dehydropantoate 2-reductase